MGISLRHRRSQKPLLPKGCLTWLAIMFICLLSLILLTAEFDAARCKILGDQNACDTMYRANNVFRPDTNAK